MTNTREQQKELLNALMLDFQDAYKAKEFDRCGKIRDIAYRWEQKEMINLNDFPGCTLCRGKNMNKDIRETISILYVCDNCAGRNTGVNFD